MEMLRILSSALQFKDNLCLYQDKPFSGIGYFINDHKIEKIIEYREGSEYGNYYNELLPVKSDLLKVMNEVLTPADPDDYEEVEPYSYYDQPFTGISYEFFEDTCNAETMFDKGWIIYRTRWNHSGRLFFYECSESDIAQEVRWHDNGTPEGFFLQKKNEFSIEAKFADKSTLESLHIDGNYFKKINNHKNIKFNIIKDLKSLENFSCSDYFMLSGVSITDDIYQHLVKKNDLSEIVQLCLYNTSLSNAVINKLFKIKNMKTVIINDKRLELTDFIRQMKIQYPHVAIRLNNHPVE